MTPPPALLPFDPDAIPERVQSLRQLADIWHGLKDAVAEGTTLSPADFGNAYSGLMEAADAMESLLGAYRELERLDAPAIGSDPARGGPIRLAQLARWRRVLADPEHIDFLDAVPTDAEQIQLIDALVASEQARALAYATVDRAVGLLAEAGIAVTADFVIPPPVIQAATTPLAPDDLAAFAAHLHRIATLMLATASPVPETVADDAAVLVEAARRVTVLDAQFSAVRTELVFAHEVLLGRDRRFAGMLRALEDATGPGPGSLVDRANRLRDNVRGWQRIYESDVAQVVAALPETVPEARDRLLTLIACAEQRVDATRPHRVPSRLGAALPYLDERATRISAAPRSPSIASPVTDAPLVPMGASATVGS